MTKRHLLRHAGTIELTYSEYLYITHGIKEMNTTEDKVKDLGINLLDFLPEPRSLSHVRCTMTSHVTQIIYVYFITIHNISVQHNSHKGI